VKGHVKEKKMMKISLHMNNFLKVVIIIRTTINNHLDNIGLNISITLKSLNLPFLL